MAADKTGVCLDEQSFDWNVAVHLTMFQALLAVMYGDSMAANIDGAATLKDVERQIMEHMLTQVRLPPGTTGEGKSEWVVYSTGAVRSFFDLAECRRAVAAERIRKGELVPPCAAPGSSE